MDMKACYILGVKVNAVARSQVKDLVESYINSGQSHQVCVPNVWCTVLMQKDKKFIKITNQSSISLPDGMPLTWISPFYGTKIHERITGYDFFFECAELAQKMDYTFFFLGSQSDVLDVLKKNLKQKYPSLNIVGAYSPACTDKFSKKETQKMIDLIHKKKPHFLWVGMTAPKQEKWIWENLHQLRVPVCVGVGAVFDFISGRKKRAPILIQKAGLEWLYRFFNEPSRLWKRYFIGNMKFIWYVLVDIAKKKIQ